jgi:PIN domain nuclease of toxin-antitoxin system
VKVLVDTSYLMPSIGVSVRGIPTNEILTLLKKEKRLAISEMSIFELSAKGAKYVATGRIPREKVLQGLKAILGDERLSRIPAYGEEELSVALALRLYLKDFIDCLILSSALIHCESLVTEDRLIFALRKTDSYEKLVATYNSKFTIQRSVEVLASTV